MARTGVSFGRGSARFIQQPTVLVICEDSKSGKSYLTDAAVHFRAHAKVEIAHEGVTHPSGIVAQAIKKQKYYDKVFCTIDRDSHACFDKALEMAKPHKKITIIPSYPCFEYWLILHFCYSRKPYNSAGKLSAGDILSKDLKTKKGMENYIKGGAQGYFKKLLGVPFETARKNSPKALRDALSNNEMNPSTRIHELLDYFEELATPKEIGTVMKDIDQ